MAGIDVAQHWHYVRWVAPTGRFTGRPYRTDNTRGGDAQMLAAQPGVTVVWVNPAHVKRAKELDDNTPTKSEAKDAGVIARLVTEGRFQPWTPREEVWAQLQSWAVTRRQQRQTVTRWEVRIAGWWALYFPEFLTVFKSWRGKAALWMLDHHPWPADVQQVGLAALARGMAAATHHRVGRKRAAALWAAVQDSLGVAAGAAGARYQLSSPTCRPGGAPSTCWRRRRPNTPGAWPP